MMATDKLKVKNWEKYQHYKDRCPPWIKLHVSTLNDRKFCALSQASRGLLMQLWVLASENEGCVVSDLTELQFRLRDNTIKSDDLNILIEKGFLKICKQTLADADSVLADAVPETETEKRENFPCTQNNLIFKTPTKPKKSFQYTEDFESFWQAYPKRIGKGKAFEEWRKVSANGRPSMEEILRAIENQRTSEAWTKDGGQYIPLPATWIHQRRWDDAPSSTDPFKGKISEKTARTLENLDRWEEAQDGK